MCEKGTNFIKFNTKPELIKTIGISVNLINKKLKPLLDKGYISYVGIVCNYLRDTFHYL